MGDSGINLSFLGLFLDFSFRCGIRVSWTSTRAGQDGEGDDTSRDCRDAGASREAGPEMLISHARLRMLRPSSKHTICGYVRSIARVWRCMREDTHVHGHAGA
eukprot:6212469-Pleurochrysis_carterae.AAC.2